MEEIVNRIANSGLVTIDLDDYFPKHPIVELDIKDWLWQGLVLREKEFRDRVETTDWAFCQGAAVAVFCSTDAIVPYWAYMLLAIKLKDIALEVAYGNKEQYLAQHYAKALAKLKPEDYKGKRVVVKGCGDNPVPISAFVAMAGLMAPFAQAIMYGEPCSTVPLYKAKKAPLGMESL